MDKFKHLVGEILTSKKALALLSGLAVLGLSKHGVDVNPDTVDRVLGFLGAYIVGQGVADMGKEKLKAAVRMAKVSAIANDPSHKAADEAWAKAQAAEILAAGKK
jgi:hypothetical protein